jgi:hypothetical protein
MGLPCLSFTMTLIWTSRVVTCNRVAGVPCCVGVGDSFEDFRCDWACARAGADCATGTARAQTTSETKTPLAHNAVEIGVRGSKIAITFARVVMGSVRDSPSAKILSPDHGLTEENVERKPNCMNAVYEFQVTRESCFLRDSHSEPTRIRGATSINRGMRRKTAAEVQGRPSRVR